MSKLDKDQVIENFTNAYTAANGKKPNIEAGGGWYSVDGGKKVRLAALDEMATELSSATAKAEPAKKKAAKPAAEKKAAKPAAEKKAAKPAAEKKAAKPAAEKKAAKPAAKKPAAKSKKSKADFSVKAFWAEKITEQNPGSKLPR